MNRQRKAHLWVVVCATPALFLFPLSASAQIQRAAESFDGPWLTDGYGELIEVQGDNLQAYENHDTELHTRGQGHAKDRSEHGS